MVIDWPEFCRLVGTLPEVVKCDDADLHQMLLQPVPSPTLTDEIGRPLPGSSLIVEHPDLPNYRRVMDLRHKACLDDDDSARTTYYGRLVAFLESHSKLSRFVIVTLSTDRDCYEILYFSDGATVLFSPVRCLEGGR